ncbi:hypothetical protein [Ralstonia pseudosolanacearum]|uniref:hypothetical protein n=1 Tax=Ralstonia pseudosolanacearum TaxID=1310165 RepID=UPI003F79D4A4
MATKKTVEAPCIETKQGSRKFLITKLPASVVTAISYAAVRGQSDEIGAVQRLLNQGRINRALLHKSNLKAELLL